jgi:hypothetical protein
MSESTGVCVVVPLDQENFRPLVYGMAILVSDREVITCAHVITATLNKQSLPASGEIKVRLVFPFVEGPLILDGTVDRSRYFPEGLPEAGKITDVAVIELLEAAPPAIGRAILRSHEIDATVKIYGFRAKQREDGTWVSHPDGEFVEGKVMAALPGGRVQFDGLHSQGATVEKGFSGAGVYDARLGAVVGMVVESDREKERKLAQFIDVASLNKARGTGAAAAPPPSVQGQPTSSRSLIRQTEAKMSNIAEYLRKVAEALPAPDFDADLLPYLSPILTGLTEDAVMLRVAFGFPKSIDRSRPLFDLISSGESTAPPFLGILAQRVNTLLWRFNVTLDEIRAAWTKEAKSRSDAIQTICAPYLPAHQPSVRETAAALEFSTELKPFIESAPDPTLYTVLRGFDRGTEGGHFEKERRTILDFMYRYLSELVEGARKVDDSSNAWWALRTGICAGDDRFGALLPAIAEKYYDIIVPSAEVARLAAAPEIYRGIGTTAYTLSNIQAILEFDGTIEPSLKEKLHQIIHLMLDRLLKTPRSNQLYLASVHYEGLGNYIDYVNQQKLTIGED